MTTPKNPEQIVNVKIKEKKNDEMTLRKDGNGPEEKTCEPTPKGGKRNPAVVSMGSQVATER